MDMRKKKTSIISIVVSLVSIALFFPFSSHSAEEYPVRPIELVCPYAAGGGSDMHTRALVAVGAQYLGQQLIPVIRSGATGTVGTAYVATSRPDGYTLLVGEQGSVIVQPSVETLPYKAEDLIPIGQITSVPMAYFVLSSSPWKTLKEFIEDAKKRPLKIRYASAGMYGVDHLSMEALSQLAGIKLTHMPTAGAAPAMTAVLGGHVEASVLNPATVGTHLSVGTVRALAITGAERLKDVKDFENIPTLKELGFNYEMYLWWGLFAPKGTPKPIILKLRGALKQISEDRSFQRLMSNMGFVLKYMSGEDLEKRYHEEVVTLRDLIKTVK